MSGRMTTQLMTVEEVAEFLRVKTSTVYEWAKNGKLPGVKVGRLWRFERKKVEAWLQNAAYVGEGKDDSERK